MKWIAIITLLAIVSSCDDGASHREYIITQAQLEDDVLINNATEVLD